MPDVFPAMRLSHKRGPSPAGRFSCSLGVNEAPHTRIAGITCASDGEPRRVLALTAIRLALVVLTLLTVWTSPAIGYVAPQAPEGAAGAEELLIKVKVDSPAGWETLRSLGAELYYRADNTAVIRLAPPALPALESSGFVWRELRGTVSAPLYLFLSETELPSLPHLGAVVLDQEEGGAIVAADPDAVAAARSLGVMTVPLRGGRYIRPDGFLGLEFIHEVVSPNRVYEGRLRRVSGDSLRATIQHLQNYGTRYYESYQIIRAANWLERRLFGMGYEETYQQEIRNQLGQRMGTANVVATKQGQSRPRYQIVVGGHYDSIVHGFPINYAPGADDNASGTAATLEIARLLHSADLDATVHFVLFTAEEIGLFGSEDFATRLEEDDVPTDEVFCINMDMVAHTVSAAPKVRFYYDRRSIPLAELATRVTDAYTTLVPYMSGWSPYSDHASFSNHGYPAIFVQEYDENLRLHTPDDLLIHLNMDYAAEVVRVVMALVLHLGRLADPPESIVATQQVTGETLLEWSHSPDADLIGYHVTLLDTDNAVLAERFTTEDRMSFEPAELEGVVWARVTAEDVLGEGTASDRVAIGSGGLVFLGAIPNPARSDCRFELFIPGSGGPLDASLKILDVSGRLVRSVHDGDLSRGHQVLEWDTAFADGDPVPEGVYFYRLDVEGLGTKKGKLIVVR